MLEVDRFGLLPFGPLLFSYLQGATFRQKQRGFYLAYIPSVLYVLVIAFWLFEFNSYTNWLHSGALEPYWVGNEIFIVLFNLTFIIKGYILILKYQRAEHDNLSFEQSPIRFFKTLTFSIGFAFMLWLIMYFLKLINGADVQYGLVWTCISISTFILGYYNINHNGLFMVECQIG